MGGFTVYPTLSLASKALKKLEFESEEDCATACIAETDFSCRSFDFCAKDELGTSAGSGKMFCLLHEYHVTASANQRAKEQKDGAAVYIQFNVTDCLHYSSKLTCCC